MARRASDTARATLVRVLAVALGGIATGVVSGAGCGSSDVAVLSAGGDGGPPGNVGGDGALLGDADAESRAAFCAGSGPPLLLDDTDAGVVTWCTGQVAALSFRYALCTCDGYVSDHALVTDAFDSTQGPYDSAHAMPGGSVGTNGNLNATAAMTIGGSLWASDATGLTTSASLSTLGELHAQGEVHSGPALDVSADAWMAGGIQTGGDLTVTGTLHVPAGAPLSVSGTESVGATVIAPVQVAPACDCAAPDLVDVPGIVETYRATNDDAAAGIDPAVLENVQSALTMALPCGRIFFTSIGAAAPVHLTAQGRVAVFVAGALSTTSDFVVEVPPGSEVDLFIEGEVTVGGAFETGAPDHPADMRTYVGAAGTVNLQGVAQLTGNLYAPRSALVLGAAAPTTLFGALFTERLSAGADLTIHYDEAVLAGGTSAGCTPPTRCSSCRDCGGQACNSGTCGGCTDSSQCCAPLVCVAGSCGANVE